MRHYSDSKHCLRGGLDVWLHGRVHGLTCGQECRNVVETARMQFNLVHLHLQCLCGIKNFGLQLEKQRSHSNFVLNYAKFHFQQMFEVTLKNWKL